MKEKLQKIKELLTDIEKFNFLNMNAPQYITDNTGKKLFVILSLAEYEKIIKDLEELEDIRLYDEAMAEKSPSIPADEAFKRIEAKRKK